MNKLQKMSKFNRRSFLKNSALLTVGGIVAPKILQANFGGISASGKLNVAFIGAGGKGMHAINLLVNHPKINVVALADVNDQSAANAYKLLPNIPHFRDFRKMLEKLNIYDLYLEQKRKYPTLKISKEEIKEAIQNAKSVILELKMKNQEELLPRTTEKRVKLRLKYQKRLNIYK